MQGYAIESYTLIIWTLSFDVKRRWKKEEDIKLIPHAS